MNDLMKFFNARRNAYHTNPKLIDDVIYTPYVYELAQSKYQDSRQLSEAPTTGDLLGIPELRQETPADDDRTVKRKKKSVFDATSHEAEIFIFPYGTVVIWGMTEAQEKRFLTSMLVLRDLCNSLTHASTLHSKRFEVEKLGMSSHVSLPVEGTHG
jgi:uncharacterized Rmd1/YagE family protein